jgi:hypothetical protein
LAQDLVDIFHTTPCWQFKKKPARRVNGNPRSPITGVTAAAADQGNQSAGIGRSGLDADSRQPHEPKVSGIGSWVLDSSLGTKIEIPDPGPETQDVTL